MLRDLGHLDVVLCSTLSFQHYSQKNHLLLGGNPSPFLTDFAIFSHCPFFIFTTWSGSIQELRTYKSYLKMLKSTFLHTQKEFPRQFICGCELENNLVSLDWSTRASFLIGFPPPKEWMVYFIINWQLDPELSFLFKCDGLN